MKRLAKLNMEAIVTQSNLARAILEDRTITIMNLRHKLNQQKEFIAEEMSKECMVHIDVARHIVDEMFI
jgi:hypothetical protein